MRKSNSRKTILKEAGVLLIAAILVLTVTVSVPMKAAQTLEHDVGVTEIISPTTGPVQTYHVEVTVKNFGTSAETGVPVEVVIENGLGILEYDSTVMINNINAEQSMNVTLPDWYPPSIGEYQVTACTQLSGDENPNNDCLNKTIYIVIEFMGLGVAPLGLAELEIIDGILSVSNCVSGQNETDGVWTNLEDTGNLYHVWMEYPSDNDNDSLPVGSGSIIRRNVIAIFGEPIPIFGEPVPGAEIFIEQCQCCLNTNCYISRTVAVNNNNGPPLKANVEAFNGNNLVFSKEHIPMKDGRLNIGKNFNNSLCKYLGYHFGNQLSIGFTFSDPVNWTWLEQGVNNRSVDRIEVIPENLNYTLTAYSYASSYAENISEFNITEMHTEVNNPPSAPTINGPTSGKIKQNYNFTFVSTDPEGNNISYLVDWGDGSNMSVVGPYPSNEQVTLSHSWSIKGTYAIRMKAMDQYYSESTWASLKVTMPFSYQPPNHPFLSWLFERFSHAFPILRHLLGY